MKLNSNKKYVYLVSEVKRPYSPGKNYSKKCIEVKHLSKYIKNILTNKLLVVENENNIINLPAYGGYVSFVK